jgi:hypothetical protein
MASFLVRALDLPPVSDGPFTDIAVSVHEANINALFAAGITTGCTPTRYCPEQPVTREQMASFLTRAFALTPGPDQFTDDEASIHEDDINSLAAAAITTGCTPTTFCPGDDVTREQMAAFLYRSLNPGLS